MRARIAALLVVLGAWAPAEAQDLPPGIAPVYAGADMELLGTVRVRFEEATESGRTTRELVALLDGRLPADRAEWAPVFRAFRAALEALLGKHSLAPWSKFHHVKAGLAQFAGLVEAHPESVEIRMLRFALFVKLPGVFETGEAAVADRAVLVAQFEGRTDPVATDDYCRRSIAWILANGRPTPDERRRLEAALARLP